MKFFAIVLSLLAFSIHVVSARPLYPIYPPEHANWVHPEDPVIVQFHRIEAQPPDFEVRTSNGNLLNGSVKCVDDGHTWSFAPFQPFPFGETMTVKVASNDTLLDYSFTIADEWKPKFSPQQIEYSDLATKLPIDETPRFAGTATTQSVVRCDADLPLDFPTFQYVRTGHVAPGYLYTVAFSIASNVHHALVIDDSGKVVFYRRMTGFLDEVFEPVETERRILQFQYHGNQFVVLDSSMTVLDTIKALDAYSDFHDARLLPNGHTLILASERRPFDMTDYDGSSEAEVSGTVVQEFNADGGLVLEWRSLDHLDVIKFTDVDGFIDLTAPSIDMMHSNSVEMDVDGNLILSHRSLSEVDKIRWGGENHGEVMWRLGGHSSTLTVVGDSIPLSAQHHARLLPNGDLMIFDNGSYRFPPSSRIVAYAINELDSTATLAWEKTKDYTSYSRGSAQLLSNGDILGGWGSIPANEPNVIEWNSNNQEVAELTFDLQDDQYVIATYRALKSTILPKPRSPEVTGEATANGYRLFFCKFNDTSAVDYDVMLTNPNQVTQSTLVDGATSLDLPDLWPGGTWQVSVVALDPDGNTVGDTSDVYSFDYTPLSAREEATGLPRNALVTHVWPNPFNNTAQISIQLATRDRVSWQVFNVLGQPVLSVQGVEMQAGQTNLSFSADDLSSGVYLLRISSRHQGQSTKRIVLIR